MIGHSSGAQLAAFVALDGEARSRHGGGAGSIAGLATIGGPLNLSLCADGFVGRLVDGFAGPADSESRRDADPIHVIGDEIGCPVLCVHGARDPVVPSECSRSFVERVNARNPGAARLAIAEGLHHVDTLLIFLQPELEPRVVLESWLEEVAGAW